MTATRLTSPTTIEVDIQDFFKTSLFVNRDNEFIFDTLDCLTEGYCTNAAVLTKFQEWYSVHYPLLKASASLQNNQWITNINVGVLKIDGFIKRWGDFSQDHLTKQFILFLKKYPIPNVETYIRKLEKGHCSGYSFFVTNLLRLEFLSHKPEARVDNWSSFLSVFSTLSKWDGASDLRASRRDILAMFYSIYNAQHSLSMSGVDQSEWEHLYSDSADRQVVRIDASVGTAFNESNIAAVLNESLLKVPDAVTGSYLFPKGQGEVVTVSFRAHGHNTTLSKAILNTGVYLIHYNSNNIIGPVPVGREIAAKIVKMSHEPFKESRVESFLVEAFSFANAAASKSFQFPFPAAAELKLQSAKTICAMALRACRSLSLSKQRTLLDYTNLSQKMSLFHYAARLGRKEFAEELLEYKDVKPTALINAVTATSGRTALHIAARWGHVQFVKFILDQKANTDIKTKSTDKKFPGSIAVQTAVRFRHIEVVRILIESNPLQLQVITDQGESLLHLAVPGNRTDLVEYLLEKFREQRLDITTKLNGKSLLDLANSPLIGKQILAAQLPDAIKRKDPTELAYLAKHAAILGEFTVLNTLLDAGVNANGIYDGGKTLVHFGAAADQPEVVHLLLQHDASLIADKEQLPVYVAKEPLRCQLVKTTLTELLAKHHQAPHFLSQVQQVLKASCPDLFCRASLKEAERLLLETVHLQNSALLAIFLTFFGPYTERILNQSSVLEEVVRLSNEEGSDDASAKYLECARLLLQFGAQEKGNKVGRLLGDEATHPEMQKLFVKWRFLQGLNCLLDKKMSKKRGFFQSASPKTVAIIHDVRAVLDKTQPSSILKDKHFSKLWKHVPTEFKAAQTYSLMPVGSALKR